MVLMAPVSGVSSILLNSCVFSLELSYYWRATLLQNYILGCKCDCGYNYDCRLCCAFSFCVFSLAVGKGLFRREGELFVFLLILPVFFISWWEFPDRNTPKLKCVREYLAVPSQSIHLHSECLPRWMALALVLMYSPPLLQPHLLHQLGFRSGRAFSISQSAFPIHSISPK
jgi:hypothetical protein